MIVCACHGKAHREENVTPVRPELDIGDPSPPQGGHIAFYCGPYMRQRERARRAINGLRRANPRGRAA